MKERIYWIDYLKGFILLLVCFSHLELFPEICNYLKGARMTTFFFLSGLLFSNRKYPTFLSYFKSKCHSLLIPYFLLSFLFALFPFSLNDDLIFASEWIHIFNLSLNTELYINTFIISTIDIIHGHSFLQSSAPLWFVYTLFQVTIIYYLINKIPYKCLRLMIISGSLFIAWYCNIHNIMLPFHLSTMFTSLFFFGLGRNIQYIIELNKTVQQSKYYILLFFIIYTISYIKGGDVHLIINKLGSSFIIFLLYTINGILLLTTLFRYISNKDNIIFGIFRNISRNALIILSIHYFYKVLYDVLFHSNIIDRFLFVLVCTIISIPIFRCYLYKLIGKDKISIKESLSIK